MKCAVCPKQIPSPHITLTRLSNSLSAVTHPPFPATTTTTGGFGSIILALTRVAKRSLSDGGVNTWSRQRMIGTSYRTRWEAICPKGAANLAGNGCSSYEQTRNTDITRIFRARYRRRLPKLEKWTENTSLCRTGESIKRWVI